MRFHPIPFWKEAPFFRLLIPFSAGIFFQWHFKIEASACYLGTATSSILLILFSLNKISSRYKRYWLSGLFLNCSFFFLGLTVTFLSDGVNRPSSLIHNYQDNSILIARLEEPLSEKPKSFKTIASVKIIHPCLKDNYFNGILMLYR